MKGNNGCGGERRGRVGGDEASGLAVGEEATAMTEAEISMSQLGGASSFLDASHWQ
jgi:hypothetical protein